MHLAIRRSLLILEKRLSEWNGVNEKVCDMKQNTSYSIGGKLVIKEIGRPSTELTFCKLV